MGFEGGGVRVGGCIMGFEGGGVRVGGCIMGLRVSVLVWIEMD